MSDYATGAIVEPRRPRVRIQILTRPGERDKIFFTTVYSIFTRENGEVVLTYHGGNGMKKIILKPGQYIETKIMGS